MAVAKTNQGEFELCFCGNPEGHVGPVWHPEALNHASGAVLEGAQDQNTQDIFDSYPDKRHVDVPEGSLNIMGTVIEPPESGKKAKRSKG